MTSYRLLVKDRPPMTVGPEAPQLSVGRAPGNDWVLEDASLSRRHARFEWNPDGLGLRDLGSRFGTALNGVVIQDQVTVRPGDDVILGNVRIQVAEVPEVALKIGPAEAGPALESTAVDAAALRTGAAPAGTPWPQTLIFLQKMTLGLVRDVPVQELLENLLEELLEQLQAERGALLLKDPQGELQPSVVRVRGAGRGTGPIQLSRTLVEAALERREAILLTDPRNDPALASRSLILSGVSSAIVTPLEAEGQVSGLLYCDTRSWLKPFTLDDLHLATTLAHVAAAKLRSARLLAETQKLKALEHEMALAQAIQQRMLPLATLGDGPVDLYAELRPSRDVGGDLYDWQWHHGRLCFCIGDVSGKGVPAALVMALTKTLFRSNGRFLDDPAQLMGAMSSLIYEETGPAIFVTAFCGFFDPADGRLVYSNGGHEPPVILPAHGPARFLETRSGLGLGILPDYPVQDQETVLGEDETALLYTDGVTEAANPAGELFGSVRLLAALERRPDGAPRGVVQHLLGSVDQFAAGAPQADDITLLSLRQRRA